MEIKLKFKPGDEAWMMLDNKAVKATVIMVKVSVHKRAADASGNPFKILVIEEYWIDDASDHVDRSLLFASKQDLLASL